CPRTPPRAPGPQATTRARRVIEPLACRVARVDERRALSRANHAVRTSSGGRPPPEFPAARYAHQPRTPSHETAAPVSVSFRLNAATTTGRSPWIIAASLRDSSSVPVLCATFAPYGR